MKIKRSILESNLYKLHDQEFLDNLRIAGKIAAKSLCMLDNFVKEKASLSLMEMDQIIEQFIIDNGAIPTFKGHEGFPATCCMSVNFTLVHGTPNDYKLKEGDVVSFDVGATYNGAIADTAFTTIFGQPKEFYHPHMVKTCKDCLIKAIEIIKPDKKIGCIGNAIFKHAQNNGYSVIEDYGGHSIDLDNNIPILHAQPFIANRSLPDEGIRIQSGMVLCIEPMIIRGDNATYIGKEEEIRTYSIGSHEEHTLYVHENYVENITDRTNL